jgi:hypothetical protein
LRKIVQGSWDHNARLLVLLFSAILAALLTGCQATDKSVEEANAELACPVIIDTESWRTFDDIANRMKAGETVPDAEVEAFMDLPGMSLWSRSQAPFSPSAINMANWLDAAFGPGTRAKGKNPSSRKKMVKNYRYTHDHRETVNGFITEFEQNQRCQVDSLVQYWIDPPNRPAGPIVVCIVPSQSEVRIMNDTLLVDTGLLVAGGPDQAARQLASLLYRNWQAIPGGNPAQLEGGASLAQTWRVLTNQGVTTWIEQFTATEFRDDHPRLGKINIIPEDSFVLAVRAIGQTNTQMADILTDPTLLDKRGRRLTNWFIGQNAFQNLSFSMAATIEGQLGSDRLREAGHSVPAFLAAYQEAALLNPVPQPLPGDAGRDLYHCMPPINPDVFQGLFALLLETFPE